MSWTEVLTINSNYHLPIDDLITSRDLGFGDGRHGNIVYDGTFPYFRDKPYDRYEIQSTYFEVPAGKTLKPPLESGGLVIYSLSDIVINGTIDMKSRGRHGEIEKKAIKAVTVYGRVFELPLCGGTVQSALSGDGGRLNGPSPAYGNGGKGQAGMTQYRAGSYSSGGYSPPYCGMGCRYYASGNSIYEKGMINLQDELRRQPTGIVILIARGTITIKGKIDCSASPGIVAESGQKGYIEDHYIYGGRGGGGAQSPSGGGGITLIAKSIDRSGGVLDVSGKSYTNMSAGSSIATEYINLTHPDAPTKTFQAYGGTGGTGTPSTGYTSQAGGIKEYIYTR